MRETGHNETRVAQLQVWELPVAHSMLACLIPSAYSTHGRIPRTRTFNIHGDPAHCGSVPRAFRMSLAMHLGGMCVCRSSLVRECGRDSRGLALVGKQYRGAIAIRMVGGTEEERSMEHVCNTYRPDLVHWPGWGDSHPWDGVYQI